MFSVTSTSVSSQTSWDPHDWDCPAVLIKLINLFLKYLQFDPILTNEKHEKNRFVLKAKQFTYIDFSQYKASSSVNVLKLPMTQAPTDGSKTTSQSHYTLLWLGTLKPKTKIEMLQAQKSHFNYMHIN